jgi:hypothetical protein
MFCFQLFFSLALQSVLLRPSEVIISNKGSEKGNATSSQGVKKIRRMQKRQGDEGKKHNQKRLTNAFNHRAALFRLTRHSAGEKFLRYPLDWQKWKRDARFKLLLNGFLTPPRGCFIWHPMMHVKSSAVSFSSLFIRQLNTFEEGSRQRMMRRKRKSENKSISAFKVHFIPGE